MRHLNIYVSLGPVDCNWNNLRQVSQTSSPNIEPITETTTSSLQDIESETLISIIESDDVLVFNTTDDDEISDNDNGTLYEPVFETTMISSTTLDNEIDSEEIMSNTTKLENKSPEISSADCKEGMLCELKPENKTAKIQVKTGLKNNSKSRNVHQRQTSRSGGNAKVPVSWGLYVLIMLIIL